MIANSDNGMNAKNLTKYFFSEQNFATLLDILHETAVSKFKVKLSSDINRLVIDLMKSVHQNMQRDGSDRYIISRADRQDAILSLNKVVLGSALDAIVQEIDGEKRQSASEASPPTNVSSHRQPNSGLPVPQLPVANIQNATNSEDDPLSADSLRKAGIREEFMIPKSEKNTLPVTVVDCPSQNDTMQLFERAMLDRKAQSLPPIPEEDESDISKTDISSQRDISVGTLRDDSDLDNFLTHLEDPDTENFESIPPAEALSSQSNSKLQADPSDPKDRFNPSLPVAGSNISSGSVKPVSNPSAFHKHFEDQLNSLMHQRDAIHSIPSNGLYQPHTPDTLASVPTGPLQTPGISSGIPIQKSGENMVSGPSFSEQYLSTEMVKFSDHISAMNARLTDIFEKLQDTITLQQKSIERMPSLDSCHSHVDPLPGPKVPSIGSASSMRRKSTESLHSFSFIAPTRSISITKIFIAAHQNPIHLCQLMINNVSRLVEFRSLSRDLSFCDLQGSPLPCRSDDCSFQFQIVDPIGAPLPRSLSEIDRSGIASVRAQNQNSKKIMIGLNRHNHGIRIGDRVILDGMISDKPEVESWYTDHRGHEVIFADSAAIEIDGPETDVSLQGQFSKLGSVINTRMQTTILFEHVQ